MTQKGMDFAKQNPYSRWVIDFSRQRPTDCFRVSENKFPPRLSIFLPVIDFRLSSSLRLHRCIGILSLAAHYPSFLRFWEAEEGGGGEA